MTEPIRSEQLEIFEKLFGKDEFGEIPKAIKIDEDYKKLAEIFTEEE